MEDNIKSIGKYAGNIWKSLNENEYLSQKKILELTQLKNNEFHLGIGWLVKENKIKKSEKNNLYSLGPSNLTDTIGKKAAEIVSTLQNQSKKNVAAIAKSTDLRPKEVYRGLGWLAREGKLEIFDDKTLQKKYSLKRQ